MTRTESPVVRCVDCRSEYEPTSGGSILCPNCGGDAWVAAAITFPPEQQGFFDKD